MRIMRILNLFAGIGGNREFWGNDHEIYAVENNSKIAYIYAESFPNDIIEISDAYEYVEEYFQDFDIIWASPPCDTHTHMCRFNVSIRYNNTRNITVKIPDMKLYGLILFLQHYFRGNWIVENVKPFYKPLIKPTCIRGRHLYWSNISIPNKNKKSSKPEIGDRFTKSEENQLKRRTVNPLEGKILLDYLLEKNQMKLL